MQLTDLAFLALKGLIVASIPLSLIWVGVGAKGSDKFRRLAWVTAFFTFDLIVFGGFTRLTDSGLGCPDWPGCYAKANPIAAMHDIHAAEAAMPTGPVTMTKAWIEMIHRYLAMGVGVLIIVMMVVAWWRSLNAKKLNISTEQSPWFPTALLLLVCLQGAFGAWTVTMKLQPVIVTIHLLLAMLLLILLVWNAARLQVVLSSISYSRFLRPLALLAAIALIFQIALGGWVSTNYAVMACSDFPLCQREVIPQMDFANGFHLWRELGKTADNGYLPFAALTAIHWAHRSFAWLVVIVLSILSWQCWRYPALKRLALALILLLVAQFTTGVINVVFAWPLLAAVLHNAGAAALVIVLTLINYRLSAGRTNLTPVATTASISSAIPSTRATSP